MWTNFFILSVKFYFHNLCFETKLCVGMNNKKYFNLIIFRLYWRFTNAVYFSKAIFFFFFRSFAIGNIFQVNFSFFSFFFQVIHNQKHSTETSINIFLIIATVLTVKTIKAWTPEIISGMFIVLRPIRFEDVTATNRNSN